MTTLNDRIEAGMTDEQLTDLEQLDMRIAETEAMLAGLRKTREQLRALTSSLRLSGSPSLPPDEDPERWDGMS